MYMTGPEVTEVGMVRNSFVAETSFACCHWHWVVELHVHTSQEMVQVCGKLGALIGKFVCAEW